MVQRLVFHEGLSTEMNIITEPFEANFMRYFREPRNYFYPTTGIVVHVRCFSFDFFLQMLRALVLSKVGNSFCQCMLNIFYMVMID